MTKQKILVVDDEESLCEILKFNLEIAGFEVDTAFSAEKALKLSIKDYDLLILDIMMGKMSGIQMAQILKSNMETAKIPIIFCTAKDTENDTIAGLNIGADDYITKPFSVREVIARVKSVLRRTSTNSNEKISVEYEKLKVDLIRKRCILDGEKVSLTKKEMEILILFLKNRGVVFSREDILHRIWKDDVVVLDRTIDVNITRLRKKIGEYGFHIVTRLGYGYGFEE